MKVKPKRVSSPVKLSKPIRVRKSVRNRSSTSKISDKISSSSQSSTSSKSIKKNSFRCALCTKAFPFPNKLATHLTKVHDSLFDCFYCKINFRSRYLFLNHYAKKLCDKNKTGSEIKQTFDCKHCSLTFKRASYLNTHINGAHANELDRVSSILESNSNWTDINEGAILKFSKFDLIF